MNEKVSEISLKTMFLRFGSDFKMRAMLGIVHKASPFILRVSLFCHTLLLGKFITITSLWCDVLTNWGKFLVC